MDFQVWDAPGHINYFDSAFNHDQIFGNIGALIWVIDAQDEYFDAVDRLNTTILPFRDIQQRVLDELADAGCDNADVSFYQTSIYDHSIFEAFSKVIQKLIPQLPTLESLLNSLCANCRIEKAYLFDVLSKIYIASDTSPGDIGTYETCSDYIDVMVDISEIYGYDRKAENGDAEAPFEEYGNVYAESFITMERKGSSYLYLREMNKYE